MSNAKRSFADKVKEALRGDGTPAQEQKQAKQEKGQEQEQQQGEAQQQQGQKQGQSAVKQKDQGPSLLSRAVGKVFDEFGPVIEHGATELASGLMGGNAFVPYGWRQVNEGEEVKAPDVPQQQQEPQQEQKQAAQEQPQQEKDEPDMEIER